MFHTIYVVVCVATDFMDGEIVSFTTALNHKDIAEELVKNHKAAWGKRLIYCGVTEHEIWV